ncbi:lipase [Tsukamurella pulmonis]|uniref:Secretory lipase n=1 Tax=Tsukamurella pulmonis TaxID=47312 RepID=A0A1H1DD37_9ACTN|nr:prolyl oligopeptidase family serine peptidase [Tsukamurella pulmonis]KXO92379.1 lipase [Tsukamurella pulmonis]KXP09109.1 lipase [Tsukamurella pulmonis]RDH11456.1 alpha/beta hydrolase [Tsukamurella pulmonis]SDQ74417.1 Secretory lipase [Tsukamurella pulmonis]SUP22176.1 Predicted esterase [Tsukamurella pulmonis]
MRITRLALAATTALLGAGLVATPAGAAPALSGLDVANYAGPVPATGGEQIRSVPLDPAVSLPGAGTAKRVLYSTTDQHGKPATSTGAIFVPKGTAPAGGWPVIAWAHGTVGLGDDCAPSANPRSDRDRQYLGHWLSQGYAIVASDYAGLGTPGLMSYLNSVSTAHNVVDSVVAAHADRALNLSKKWAIVGQSQGGGAAVNSARWASEFSAGSGLDYRGVVATGTPFKIEEVVKNVGPDTGLPGGLSSAATSYTAYILAGLREANPGVDFDSVLTPRGKQAAAKAETQCYAQLSSSLAGQKPTDFVSAKVSTVPGASAALDKYMGTPTSGYDRPVFLGVGLKDTDVPVQSSIALAAALKKSGTQVELHQYPDADHSGAVLESMKDSTPFLARVFA